MEREALFNKDFYEKIYRLKLKMRFTPASGLTGNRKSGAKGSSLEFSDFREYIPGDDVRRIDWNVYGRSGKLFLKQFVEEKEAMFTIITDCSKSMEFGKHPKDKCALQLAGACAWLILEQLDRVRLVNCIDNKVFWSGAFTGRQAFGKLIAQLEQTMFTKVFDISKVIKSWNIHSKGVTLLITDGYLDMDAMDLLKELYYRKQKTIVLHVLSDEELHPDMEGTANLIDSENDAKVKITFAPSILKSYEKRLTSFIHTWQSACKKYGGAYITVPSSQSLDETLSRLITLLGRTLI